MIKKFNEFLNEGKNQDFDANHDYGVFRTGGSIGSRIDSLEKMFGSSPGILIKTFDDKLKAKEYAKRMNSRLSKGEKQYYKISYKVSQLTKSDKAALIEHS